MYGRMAYKLYSIYIDLLHIPLLCVLSRDFGPVLMYICMVGCPIHYIISILYISLLCVLSSDLEPVLMYICMEGYSIHYIISIL